MTGYVRQSVADIVPAAVVRAAPINNELNALRDAFGQAAGHKHDGTAAEGHYVPLIADSDANNKVAIDTANNRAGVFVEVGGTAVEQVRVQDGAIVPVTDNDIDLGTSSLEFKDLYIDGTANIDSLIADTADINAGTIDNTIIGATTAAAATVTSLTSTGTTTLNGTTIPASKTLVVTTDKLSALAATTSSELAGVISDETGSGALVFANTPTLVSPILGTPTSATLTNATGLPISTGVSGLATGVATFLATPSSTNLRAAITDETGTGSAVFATSPTLVTPILGTPTSATLTNATGLPISTGVSGLGTGVATALAVNVGTAGSPVVNGGALGTPSSGTVTNLTGTASININGTVGATTANTGAFTDLSSTGNTTLGDASADTVTINGTVQPGVVISGSSAGDALRITQTGTGNALLVEDSTNPDSTPFVIDASGRLIQGYTTAILTADDYTGQNRTAWGYQGNGTGPAGALFTCWSSAATVGGGVSLSRSRSATVGTQAIVSSGDSLGGIGFNGDDGTNFIAAASIVAEVDGTPGTNDMPGRLSFSTTADGASTPTERVRISSTGQTKFSYNAVVEVTDNTNAALRVTQLGTGNAILVEDSANPDSTPFVIDANGRLVVGSTAAINFPDIQGTQRIIPTQVLGNAYANSSSGIASFINSSNSGAALTLAQSRNTTIGSHTVVNSGDTVGSVQFAGSDGTNFIRAASITGEVDGTPGTNDMPGRLVLSTTADGASAPTERVRITSAGKTGFATAAPAATLHVAGSTILSNVNVLGASYDSVSFSVAGEELTPADLFFSPDGLKMFVLGDTGNDVNEYNLTTAWVVSSAVFVTNFAPGQDTAPNGLFFRPDGTKMYIAGQSTDSVYQYTLTTPWSIATATYDNISFSVGTQDGNPSSVFFKPNGLSMYVVGYANDAVSQYTLSTAWDVSTATFLQSFSVAGQENTAQGVFFTSDGSRMFVTGGSGDDINIYNLTTPWDISTAVFVNVLVISPPISPSETAPQGIYIKPDGTKMYVVGSGNDAVYQFTIPSIDIQLTGPTSAAALDVQQDLTVYGNTTGSFRNNSFKENIGGQYYNLVSQADIGTAPNEIPLNQYLGDMAYQDAANIAGPVNIQGVTVGLGGGAISTNTAVGASALAANTTGTFNTALGTNALLAVNSNNNTAIGTGALQSATTGSNNSAIGASALNNLVTGNQNTALGDGALNNLDGYNSNVAVGKNAMAIAQCSEAVAIGYAALQQSTGAANVAIGSQAMQLSTNGSSNTALGYQTMYSHTTGSGNTAIGTFAFYSATTGNENTAIGFDAMLSGVVTGDGNTVVGTRSGYNVSSGYGNTFIGIDSGKNISSGDSNTFIGFNSGLSATTGSKNVIIGGYTGLAAPISVTGSNWIVLSDGDGNVRQSFDPSGNSQMGSGAAVVYAPAPASFSALATLTNANLQTQIVVTTGTTFTLTLPLGTTLETLIPWSAVDLGYDFYVINTASGTITMAANTGVTIVGRTTVLTAVSAQFRIRRTAANTFIVYRIS